jgi:ABC-2 type transport system ATP-binding protein
MPSSRCLIPNGPPSVTAVSASTLISRGVQLDGYDRRRSLRRGATNAARATGSAPDAPNAPTSDHGAVARVRQQLREHGGGHVVALCGGRSWPGVAAIGDLEGPWALFRVRLRSHDGEVDQFVVETRGLCKRYGSTVALDDLDLEVPAGAVFGYLGPNGAGKTTTIRILMGLIRPTQGTAVVLGHDVVRERKMIHRLVGYLPGDFTAYRDLTGQQYLDYLSNLRGDVDPAAVALLAKRFDLNLDRRIGTLSHGNRQKVGIIQAFMHDPRLLMLDEPTSGLDPLMQREFVNLVQERRDAGATVFLSSHDLTEVEGVADLVAILRGGRLVMTSNIENLKTRARRRVELTFTPGVAPPVIELTHVESVRDLEVHDSVAHLVVEGSMAELLRVVAPFGIDRVISNEVDLEDVFLQYYEHKDA